MPKSFDFNAITQQTLETKLPGITLHVTTPPERLIEQLASSQDELGSLWGAEGDAVEQVRAAYTLGASIISCNLENVTLTAEDLREKYQVAPVALAAYFTTYMDFINEFHKKQQKK